MLTAPSSSCEVRTIHRIDDLAGSATDSFLSYGVMSGPCSNRCKSMCGRDRNSGFNANGTTQGETLEPPPRGADAVEGVTKVSGWQCSFGPDVWRRTRESLRGDSRPCNGLGAFATLTYYAQPIAMQAASPVEENLVSLLAFGESGVIARIPEVPQHQGNLLVGQLLRPLAQ